MTTPPPWCSAGTTLTADEIATLDALPEGAHEVEAEVHCEIQEGHPGPHMKIGQAYQSGDTEQEMWLLWDDLEIRELKVLPPCEVIDERSGHQCVLPLDHPGRCGFCLD